MPSNYRGVFVTGTDAVRPEWRAKLDGKEIKVHISMDGSLWYWDQGQKSLCKSDKSHEWAREHVHKDDLENILLSCPVRISKEDTSPLANIAYRKNEIRY